MRHAIRILRNIVLLLIAAVVILAAVLVANTLRKSSQQIAVAPVAPVAVEEQAAAQRLGAAVKLQTIASATDADQGADAFRALHDLIAKSFPAFHAAAKREIVANYSLLYTWEGSDPKAPPIALLAHQDVVPIAPGTEGDWQVPPFSGGGEGRLHLGPRFVGRQGQPVRHAGSRRTARQGKLPPQTHDLSGLRA